MDLDPGGAEPARDVHDDSAGAARRRARRSLIRAAASGAAALAAALCVAPVALVAQSPPDTAAPDSTRFALTVTVHAGGTAFTRFQNVTLDAPGAPDGAYPATIAASTAASLGADVTMWFMPWLGTRLDFIYAPSNFELRLAEEHRVEVLGEDADYRGLDYSDLSLYSLSAAGVVALPIPSRHLAPYALIGLGATLLRVDDRATDGLEHAFDGRGSWISMSGIAGLGLKIPLRGSNAGRVSLSFELVDRITRTPIEANDGRELLENDELRVVNLLHQADQGSDARYVHGVGITAGLSFATGGATPGER